MSLRSSILRASAALLTVTVLSAVALSDTIRLKDGSIIKGKIVAFSGGKFTVSIGEGSRKRQLTFDATEISSIDFDHLQNQPAIVTASDRTVSLRKDPPASQPVRKEPPVSQPARRDPPPAEPVEEEVVEEAEPTTTSVPAVTAPSNTNRRASYGKPIELSVKVLADNTANGWTNSGWVVKKGQRIRISGSGQVSIGRGKSTGPSGLYDVDDSEKLLKSVPTGALIAVIGDDNNEFIYIGSEREFTAARDGTLFLGVNEGNLNDNSGAFDVKVEISPDGGE